MVPRSAARMTASGIMAPSPVTLFYNHVPFIAIPVHKQQQETGNEKEDAIHDSECKAGLQHCACLIRVHGDWTACAAAGAAAIDAEACPEVGVDTKVGAVGIGNKPQLVDTCNKGADEAEVNKRDEDGGIAGRFATEQGNDCPHTGEDGDDKEDEDRGRGELVL